MQRSATPIIACIVGEHEVSPLRCDDYDDVIAHIVGDRDAAMHQ